MIDGNFRTGARRRSALDIQGFVNDISEDVQFDYLVLPRDIFPNKLTSNCLPLVASNKLRSAFVFLKMNLHVRASYSDWLSLTVLHG
jgi:hypothetical protein